MPVFPQKNTLPGTQHHAMRIDGYGEAGGGNRGFDMGRHIVRTLLGVGVQRISLRHQSVQPALEIAPRTGIRILLNDKTGRRVSQKHCDQPLTNTATLYTACNSVRDVIEALAFYGYGKRVIHG